MTEIEDYRRAAADLLAALEQRNKAITALHLACIAEMEALEAGELADIRISAAAMIREHEADARERAAFAACEAAKLAAIRAILARG